MPQVVHFKTLKLKLPHNLSFEVEGDVLSIFLTEESAAGALTVSSYESTELDLDEAIPLFIEGTSLVLSEIQKRKSYHFYTASSNEDYCKIWALKLEKHLFLLTFNLTLADLPFAKAELTFFDAFVEQNFLALLTKSNVR